MTLPNDGSAMFGSLGLPEILVILVLALLIFGPRRLPEVGRTIGKGLAEFRRATSDLKRSVNAELSLEDEERPATSRRSAVEGIGKPVTETSAVHELPPAPASPTSVVDEDAPPAPVEGPPGTAPRGEVADASDEDVESPTTETSRTTTNG